LKISLYKIHLNHGISLSANVEYTPYEADVVFDGKGKIIKNLLNFIEG